MIEKNLEEFPEDLLEILEKKRIEIQKINEIYTELKNYNKWVIPPTGLLPSVIEDASTNKFHIRLLNRVYIGNINIEMPSSELKKTCSVYGCVLNVHLGIDHKTGFNKGFGFVEFDNPHAAYMCIKELNGLGTGIKALKASRPANFPTEIPDSVKNADRKILYLSNIHEQIDEEQLKEIFECIGKVEDISLIPKKHGKGHMGYGYIKFKELIDAKYALNGMNNFDIAGMKMQVGPTVIHMENIPKGMKSTEMMYNIPERVLKIAEEINKKLGAPKTEEKAIILRNLIEVNELDEDFEKEIEEELNKYGKVKHIKIIIFKKIDFKGSKIEIIFKDTGAESNDVEVYCLYEENADAINVYRIMDGRYFGGRRIVVDKCSEEEFIKIN